jgi:hypothetical protein
MNSMRRLLSALVAWSLLTSAAWAQTWVDSIFPEQAHDFGTVARGSKVKHSFPIINRTNATLHIAGWKTKCGCTEVKVGARDIPPGTQTFVEATLDTSRFQGYKPSGLTLIFDKPAYVEKELNLSCFIRSDLVLNPGVVDFGIAARNASPSVELNLNYAGGMTNWGIVKVETLTDHITARLEEVPNTRTASSVQYKMTVTLNSSAPVGYMKEEITLVTNDPSSPRVPVSVTGNVQGAVVISPSILTLGTLKAGQTLTRDILVRSSQPFTVEKADSTGGDLSVASIPQDARPLQKLTVTIKAPAQPGPFHDQLEISTSLANEPPAKLTAFATVVP